MLNLSLLVTDQELQLISEIQDLGYGELYDVSIRTDTPTRPVVVPESFGNLIRHLRETPEKIKVTVHDSEPTYGELTGTTDAGLRFKKKIKF